MNKKITWILYLLLIASTNTLFSQTTLYVNDGSTIGDCTVGLGIGTSGGNGSLATPYNNLTAAVASANSGDIILIGSGTFTSDTMINVSQNNLTITGCGSSNTIFDNEGSSADTNDLLRISGNNVTLNGFSATRYNRSSGGGKAITVLGGVVDFNDIVLFSNLSNGNAALYISSNSSVTFTNSASTCNSPFLFGGGIDVIGDNSTLIISNSLIANNHKADNGDGGGLLIRGTNNNITVNNTRFQDNDAVNGGAIAIESGTTGNGNTLIINNSCFENNLASQTSSAPSGGAILVGEGEATVTITNCSFINNIAGGAPAESGDGGAISVDTAIGTGSGNVNVTITQCSFSGNTATDDGDHVYGNEGDAAFVSINECTFTVSGNDIQQRTSTEVEFTITNSGNPSLTNINPEVGSNTNPPTLVANPSCPVLSNDGCTLTCSTDTTGMTINVSDICLNSDAVVNISGATSLNNGSHSIIYDLTGANTATGINTSSNINAGIGTFTIPAGSLTNTGSTTVTITNVTEDATGCTSMISIMTSFTVNQNPTTPTATVTVQPTCTVPTGTITVTTPTLGTNEEYVVTGTSPVVVSQSNTTGIFTGLVSGDYEVTVSNTVTGCVSTATTLTVNTIPSNPTTPTASITVQPTCTVPTGTITVTAPTLGTDEEYVVTGTSPVVASQSNTTGTFTGLASGDYEVIVSNTATGCESTATTLTVNVIPNNPTTPTASITVQPTCTVPTGTITVTAPTLGTEEEYVVTGTSPVVASQSNTTGIFTGLTSGDYEVTVSNTVTRCVSTATTLTVNAIPSNPTTPTASITVQPTCTVPTGTITVTAPTLGTDEEYVVTGTLPVVVSQSNTTGIFTGLASGDYEVTVSNTVTGCESTATTLTVNAIPNNPTTPTASITVQPTCTVPTGTITVTAPTLGTDEEYVVTGTSPVVASQSNTTGIFTGLVSGDYEVIVSNTATGCVSTATTLTVNAIPNNPTTPTASITVQPTCTVPTGTITVTAPTLGTDEEYVVTGTSPVVASQSNTSGIFTGLASGDYEVTVSNTTTGCVSTATILTVNTIPSNPTTPTASVTVQPTCTVPTGTITVTAPTLGTDEEYVVTGTLPEVASQSNTSGIFTGFASGDYEVTVSNTTTGCESTAITLTINGAACLQLTKTVTIPGSMLNDVIVYDIVVTNTGNVALTNIEVTDANADTGSIVGSPIASLPPGDSVTVTATQTITQTDINAGYIENTAIGIGDSPTGMDDVMDVSDAGDETVETPNGDGTTDGDSTNDPTVTIIASNPQLTVTKTIATPGSMLNDVIVYDIVVTNTGNVTLTNIEVTDANADAGSIVGSPIASLLPGDSVTVTATQTITQTDINAGYIENTAIGIGDSPTGMDDVMDVSDAGDETVETPDGDGTTDGDSTNDPTVTIIASNPQLTVTKTIATPGSMLNDVIVYDIVVTNTGNVTLTNIEVTDANADAGSIVGSPIASLLPGDSVTVTATQTITQTDINAGYIENTAIGIGDSPTGMDDVMDVSDAGDETVETPDGDGTPDGDSTNDPTVTTITSNPELTVTKTIATPGNILNDVIVYDIVVTNTGNVTLTNIEVTDVNADTGSIVGSPIASLLPGDSVTVTATQTITQTDINAGYIENTAIGIGDSPTGMDDVMDVSDAGDETVETPNGDGTTDGDSTNDPTVTTITSNPQLTVTKTIATPGSMLNDVIVYDIVVTNTGNVTLTNIEVTDANADTGSIVGSPIASLLPGDSVTVTATQTITQTDINAGYIENTAIGIGDSPTGMDDVMDVSDAGDETVETPDGDGTTDGDSTNDPTVTIIEQSPSMILIKTSVLDLGIDGILNAGDIINYDFSLENTGNVNIANVAYTDALLGITDEIIIPESGDTNNNNVLDIGETWLFSNTYTVTQSDINAGEVLNTAIAIGDSPTGIDDVMDVSDSGDETVDTDDDPDTDPTNDPTNTTLIITEVIIPDGFSPNDDGVNDSFEIPNVSVAYPNFKLEIYNRWGNLVFEGNRNNPTWDGKSTGRTNISNGEIVPNGVYFYVLYYNNGILNPKQGRLYLGR